MRFLIIDDSSADRELSIQKLRKEFSDSEFIQVSRLDKLNQVIEDDNFDIVITDYQLNWTDGLQVLNQVKLRYPDIPVLMVTGSGNEEVAVEGFRSGLSNYILKNHLDRLPLAVHDSLERSRLHKQYEHAIEQLRLSEERYREIFEQGLTAVFVARQDGTLLTCNPAFARMFACDSVESALCCSLQQFYPQSEHYQALIDLLTQQKRLEHHEASMLRYDGRAVHIIGNINGTFDAQGQLLEIKGYFFDHTEQKKLTEQLQQAQRLESVGLLVSGIAHDFNNMLAGILGYTRRSMSKIATTHPLHENLFHIQEIASRAARMTHQLLAFSRRQVLEPSDVDLNNVVENLLSFLGNILVDQIEIEFIPAPDLYTVHVDYAQIEQVLMNLCVNAHDAMPEGGRIVIRTQNVSSDTAQKVSRGQLRHAPHTLITVQDNGVGMDEETRSRIFEPFFTTKAIGKGTGLGLAMVHGIIGQHDGFIHVESTPGQGTCFFLYLPAVDGIPVSVESDMTTRAPHPVAHGEATILVVEDDPDIRYLMEDALHEYGYNVISASDGVEGLKLFEQDGMTISLIISDLVTPKMNGKELYERVHKINADAKFLFVSGYQANQISNNFVLEKGFSFLPKPFDLDELAARVQELLDS